LEGETCPAGSQSVSTWEGTSGGRRTYDSKYTNIVTDIFRSAMPDRLVFFTRATALAAEILACRKDQKVAAETAS